MKQEGLYQIKQVLTARAAGKKVPISGAFELTPRCNFRCKMCYVRLDPEQMAPIGRERTAAQWLQLGRQAREAGLVFLLLTGGEPFLRPDFEEIYTGLTELGLSISINTNGSLLDGRMMPCGMLNEPAARPFDSSFSEAWRQIVEKTGAISLCADCKTCPIKGTCTNCAAVTSAETGTFSGRPDYMCRVNQSYRQWLRRLAEGE